MQAPSCLALEGGALRGVYTSGVQGVLHSEKLRFDAVFGTSAGAMNGINFVTGQPERSYFINYHFAHDKNFMGLRPLLREGQVFSFQYMFGPVNNRYPLDLHAFHASDTRFVAVASDMDSGEPAYLERTNCSDMMQALQASGSMPLLSKPVLLDGHRYLDGGPAIPVPYRQPLREGYQKVVLVLTRHKGYRKKPLSRFTLAAARQRFHRQPHFIKTMQGSPDRYNAMMDEIDALEERGRIFVLRPSEEVTVSRTEKNLGKLEDLFHLGRADACARLPALLDYLDA